VKKMKAKRNVKCLPGAAEICRRMFQLDDFGEVRKLLQNIMEP